MFAGGLKDRLRRMVSPGEDLSPLMATLHIWKERKKKMAVSAAMARDFLSFSCFARQYSTVLLARISLHRPLAVQVSRTGHWVGKCQKCGPSVHR
jgi:hypothetical protein